MQSVKLSAKNCTKCIENGWYFTMFFGIFTQNSLTFQIFMWRRDREMRHGKYFFSLDWLQRFLHERMSLSRSDLPFLVMLVVFYEQFFQFHFQSVARVKKRKQARETHQQRWWQRQRWQRQWTKHSVETANIVVKLFRRMRRARVHYNLTHYLKCNRQQIPKT